MIYPVKICIKKSGPVGRNWVRFKQVDKILLAPNSSIKTENELCKYIYKKFGEGRYLLLAFQKKYKGFWCFWIGNIFENGFIRDLRKNKDLEQVKRNYDGNIEAYDDEVQFSKDMFEIDKRTLRYGPVGIIKRRPGIMHPLENELGEKN